MFEGLKYRDFSWFIMNFQKIKKKIGFSQCFEVISSNIQEPRSIRLKAWTNICL